MKKILLLINPNSRSGQTAENDLIAALKDAQHTIVNQVPLPKDADFCDLIQKHKNEADLVLIGGGDGSMNAALNALVETQLPLLVFPQGTANNLARSLNLSSEIPEVVKLVDQGKITAIDLGSVNGIYFINVAGIGLSAKVNRDTNSKAKRIFGVFAFIATAAKKIIAMKPFRATLTKCTEGQKSETQEVRSWQISVCNGKYYGSGLIIDDKATLKDETLHLLSTEVKTGWQGLKLVPSLYSGKYKPDQDITLMSHSEIKINTPKPMKIDVDGDIKTQTPAHFKVHPKVLKLMVPNQAAQPNA